MTHETIGRLELEYTEFIILPVLQPLSESRFFRIPRLDNKPQDPIVQTIQQLPRASEELKVPSQANPLLSRVGGFLDVPIQVSRPPLWHEPWVPHVRDVDYRISWDSSLFSHNRHFPFLTEQHLSPLCNWATHAISSKGNQPAGLNLFHCLHLVVLGTSSPLYVWDVHSQSYVRALSSNVPEFIDMSPSILQRFLDLGALVRRLEQLIKELHQRRTDTTVHAFAHGLSSILMSIRNRISHGPLSYTASVKNVHSLARVWPYYAESEQIVISLASMCSRSMDIDPGKFLEIPTLQVDLLSLVYETFEMHVERHSPRAITAVMAYVLTVSSKPYILALCKSLAYGETFQTYNTITIEKTRLMDYAFDSDEVENWRCEEGSIDPEGPFPKFIPDNLATIFPVAHKSLKFLRAAKPEHPIFSTESSPREISWTWNEENIKSFWNRAEVNGGPAAREVNSPQPLSDGLQAECPPGNYNILTEFRVFDSEPQFPLSSGDSEIVVDEFIANFPNILPNITPNPSHLCEAIFLPLQDHAASLSRTLLAVFLDPSSFLCIDAHLGLLRSHMLLTSHSFKSQLSSALLSDAEDRETQSAQLHSLLRYKSKGASPSDQSHTGRWPVGLASLLVTRDSWPPGGSELSFLLRTVIVDSQKKNTPSTEDLVPDTGGAHQVMGEADFRLGFAIRELSGRGRDRWLDPLSIEALDFLYLDYKVPQPLQALIPTAVLSKYQRIFTFLLRLMRVECAIRSVFRLTRNTAPLLFPTLSSSRRLLLHFRFAAHSFLSTLSTYIYDAAIGGNFDCFLLRIAACRENMDAPNGFRDIFALAECHSSVLDDILSACLLRSSQRAASELLRGTLEVVLEFCVLVGDLKDSRTAEYQASPTLKVLYASFRKKVSALIRTLEVMLEKHGKAQVSGQFQTAYPEGESRMPPGGVDALRHLLAYLNQNNWWARP